jgi:hypothetical protein
MRCYTEQNSLVARKLLFTYSGIVSLYSIIAFVRRRQGNKQQSHAGADSGGGTLL